MQHGWFFQHGVAAFLGFRRQDVSNGLLQPTIVGPVDRGQGGELDCVEAPPSSTLMDALRFGESVDCLGKGIVIGISHASDRRLYARFGQTLGVADADILSAPVGVMHEAAAMDGPPFMEGLLESIEDKARTSRRAYRPADEGCAYS